VPLLLLPPLLLGLQSAHLDVQLLLLLLMQVAQVNAQLLLLLLLTDTSV
jgi:hypothetical protein